VRVGPRSGITYAVTDWRQWYTQYDDPDTSLARRLVVVRQRIGEALATLRSPKPLRSAAPLRILSLCSGDGRDLLPELVDVEPQRYRAVLVESDRSIAADAVKTSGALGLDGVRVITGDAGTTSTFIEHLPVDLLLLCGIFGNVSPDDIQATLMAAPAMLVDGGFVIWTRGSFKSDLRPTIRAWVQQAGLVETSWDSEPDGYGVGVARLTEGRPGQAELPAKLFSFIR
jgi:hypothetical protein